MEDEGGMADEGGMTDEGGVEFVSHVCTINGFKKQCYFFSNSL